MKNTGTFYAGHAGFTLVEMLVTIGIAAIMMLGIQKIFSTTSEAISIGKGTGDMLVSTQMINEHFVNDGEEMVGPGEGGVLVILNYLVNDADGFRHTSDGPWSPLIAEDVENGSRYPIRSDQLMFIRKRGELEPICPGGQGNFCNDSSAAYVRMWYGHLLRTNPNGSDPEGNAGGPDRQFGPNNLGWVAGMSGLNTLAIDWILGRQATFLDPSDVASGWNLDARGGFVNGAYRNGAEYNAPVSGYGGSIPGNIVELAYMGLTDIATQAFEGVPTFGANVGSTGLSFSADMTGTYSVGAGNAVGAGNGIPYSNVYSYTYGDRRLRVNSIPQYAAGSGTSEYNSWQIAQTHPIFAEHVSGFVIEFAGDYLDGVHTVGKPIGLLVDTNGDGVFGDGIVDTENDGADNISIKWYSMDNPPPPGVFSNSFQGSGVTPINDNGTDSNVSLPVFAHRGFVFKSGAGQTSWPRMIRIRYRLHDVRGQVSGTDGEFGRWFEQIIEVPWNR